MKRALLLTSATVLALLAGLGAGFLWWGLSGSAAGADRMPTREQVRRYMGDFAASQYEKMLQYGHRSDGLLRVGDPAPDLTLKGLDGEPRPISSFHSDKPLVLTFGSYT